MGFGSILAQGIAGAVAGAGQGAADQALLEQKQEMQRLRDERLSQLRLNEFKQELGIKTEANRAEEARQQKQVGDFFSNTQPKGTTTTTDAQDAAESGGQLTEGQSTTPPSELDSATYRYNEALKTGNTGIINEARARLKDVEANEERKSRDKRQDAELDLNRRRTEADEKRAEAYIKKTLSPDGKDMDPAKIREVKDLANMAFNGDVQKAVAYVYGSRDKPRSEAIIDMAKLIKDDPETVGDTKKLMQRATEMVDNLRTQDTSSRGGVSAGPKGSVGAPQSAGVVDSNRASGTIKKAGDVAKPTSKAEYDALPSGSLWVDPRDGKTYRKP